MKSFTPTILIVISIGLFFLHISPRYQDIQTLSEQSTQYRQALSKAAELGNTRDQLLTKYNSFSQDNLTRLNHLVPDTLNTVKLIADINSIAGRYGMTVRTVQVQSQATDNSQAVGTPATTKPYQTTAISFRVSSGYPNLVAFLQDLEKSLQLVDVESVTFQTPSDSGTNAGVYEYQISIQTYSLK